MPRFIEVPACRSEGAKVVWINPDAQEILNQESVVRPKAEDLAGFIVRQYAWRVGGSGEEHFSVDMYGSSGTTRFGGSGRAGNINGMQVKGVGATPLVYDLADWHHRHGAVMLEEAIREAVFSEVAHREFPLGAVRTLAVLETDGRLVDPSGIPQRTALLVRPFAPRACHLERAFCFGASAEVYARRGHLKDVARVHAWMELTGFCSQQHLNEFATKLGRQIAHCHMAKWFHGGWYSSVMCLDGRMIDFGSSRRVQTWRSQAFENFGPSFGSEPAFAEVTISSLGSHIHHYCGQAIDHRGAIEEFRRGYARQLERECLQFAGRTVRARMRSDPEFILTAFHTAFYRSQRASTDGAAQDIASAFWESILGSDHIRFHDQASRICGSRESVQHTILELVEGDRSIGAGQKCIDNLIQDLILEGSHVAI